MVVVVVGVCVYIKTYMDLCYGLCCVVKKIERRKVRERR